MAKIYKTKIVYEVNTKTNLRHKLITAKEIDFDHCQLAELRRT